MARDIASFIPGQRQADHRSISMKNNEIKDTRYHNGDGCNWGPHWSFTGEGSNYIESGKKVEFSLHGYYDEQKKKCVEISMRVPGDSKYISGRFTIQNELLKKLIQELTRFVEDRERKTR